MQAGLSQTQLHNVHTKRSVTLFEHHRSRISVNNQGVTTLIIPQLHGVLQLQLHINFNNPSPVAI